jgi:hypothetical protein
MDINLPRSQNKRLSVEIALSKMCYLNRIIDKKKTGDLSVDSSPEKGSTVSATKKEEVTPPLQVTKDPVIDISDKPALKEESPESVQEPIEKLKEVEPQKKAETVNEETVPSEGTTINQIKSDKNPSVIKTPTLSSNLDVFLNGGVNKKTKKKQTKVFDLDGVQEIFDTYQKKTTSPSVKSAITNIKIELAGSDILILSPIQIYLDFIRQETPLIELLHETYSNSYNKILYEVSEKTFPNYEAPKKPKHLTTSDKYELLVQKNPHFVKFVDAFKLKVLNN